MIKSIAARDSGRGESQLTMSFLVTACLSSISVVRMSFQEYWLSFGYRNNHESKVGL